MKKLLLLSLAISTATMAITKEDATTVYNSLNENLNNQLTKLQKKCPASFFEVSSTADISQECADALEEVTKDMTPNTQNCQESTGNVPFDIKKSTYEFLKSWHLDDPLSHLNAGNALAAVLGLAALAAAYKYDVYGKMYRMAFGGDTPKENDEVKQEENLSGGDTKETELLANNNVEDSEENDTPTQKAPLSMLANAVKTSPKQTNSVMSTNQNAKGRTPYLKHTRISPARL